MKHLGDITKISGYDVEPVNVIIGGSPCQDLSIAGKRAGLSGERSGLFMEQLRIIKEMRKADEQRGRTGSAIRPRFDEAQEFNDMIVAIEILDFKMRGEKEEVQDE